MHPYLDFGAPIPFAHRGGAGESPENTLAAFQRAVDIGYCYLETDVHATSDGVLMAFHDDDLQRSCGVASKISQLTYAQVSRLRVDNCEPIPTLAEVLGSWSSTRINIDCKSDAALEPLRHILTNARVRERVCIGSFSDRRLRFLREQFGSDLCTSMGPREVANLRILKARYSKPSAMAAQVPPTAGPLALVTRQFVDMCHDLGLPVHVWTIDDKVTMTELLDMGVDGIMTDQPSILKHVLVERNQWIGAP